MAILYTSSDNQSVLKTVNSIYTIQSPGGDLVMRRGNGSEYVESSRYAYTAVEPKADGNGYVAILTFSNGRVSIREFDADGVLQNFTAPQALDDVMDQEAALNIDIDGDGVIGAKVNYVYEQGSVPLKTVNGIYTIETPDGDLVMRRGNGSEYVESSRYAYTAVEPKADGNGYVAILTFSNGRVSIREFDADGVLQDFTAPQALDDVMDQEAALNIDIDGDGVIGAKVNYVYEQGSVPLKTVNGIYTIETPDGDLVMRRGNGSEYVESSRYAYTAVEPKADGNGYVAILTFSNGRVSIREFDASGVLQNFTAPQAVDDVVDQEATLNIDIDGDGVIGAEVNYVYEQGSVPLKTVNGIYTIETPDGDLVMRRGNGSEYVESSRYAYTAVEPKADGNGYVAILTFSNGRVSIREFDASGVLQDFTAPQLIADVIDQEAALNIDIDGDGEIKTGPEPEPTPELEAESLRLELPLGDGWTPSSNSINFDLVFPSVATLENVSLKGGGALSLSSSGSTLGGQTTASYSISAANGTDNGALELDFDVSEEDANDLTIQIQGLIVNGESLGTTSYVVEDNSLIKLSSEPVFDFELIQETPKIDTIGYDTNYSNVVNNLLTLPDAQIGTISENTPTQAYLHIDEGEDFVFDHDTFELRADENKNYRIKITPENTDVFQGNIIAYNYKEDGSRGDGFIMNLIGNSSSFIDGALYSDVFSMTVDERKYMSLSMRWNGDAGVTADGPEPYQVELIAVGEPIFDIVQETYEEDTVGYDLGIFKNIVNNVFTLPDAKIALVDANSPAQAYLHIDEGESFLFDHDSFELRADKNADYRIKIIPENPDVFQSNIMANTYKEDGSRADGLIMNLIGNSNSFIDGALYSDVFSMTADERKYMSLSMRWDGDAGVTADGPAPYTVELEVVGTAETSYDDILF